MTECRAGVLKLLSVERYSAGRFLAAARPVNGDGTRATANCSKASIGFLVGRAQVFDVQRLNPAHPGAAVLGHFPGNRVTRLDGQGGADILRNCGLALSSDLGDFGNRGFLGKGTCVLTARISIRPRRQRRQAATGTGHRPIQAAR